MQRILADQEFKRAISYIDFHKLRNDKYLPSLDSLEFVNSMGSSIFHAVEYIPMDSVYDLKLDSSLLGFGKEEDNFRRMQKHSPDKFWQGLGCVQSNLK